jgi:hypothetical protein
MATFSRLGGYTLNVPASTNEANSPAVLSIPDRPIAHMETGHPETGHHSPPPLLIPTKKRKIMTCQHCFLCLGTPNVATGKKHSSILGCPFTAEERVQLKSMTSHQRQYIQDLFLSKATTK